MKKILILVLVVMSSGLIYGLSGDGSPEYPYQIYSQADLAQVSRDLSASYILKDDITIIGNYSQAVIASDEDTPFTGSFDGNGHSIRNLTIISSSDNSGLFGYVYEAVISGVSLENVNVEGGYHAGGLVGYAKSSTITDCFTTGNISGGERVGGMAGDIWQTSISNSYSEAEVNGLCRVGGLVGHSSTNSHIDNCHAVGDVLAIGDDGYVGGLVGGTYSSAETNIYTNCYATGRVIGINNVGGLIGKVNRGTVIDCYATGMVSGDTHVGGLVGYLYSETNDHRSSIIDSYSTGSVAATGLYSGGLAGRIFNATVTDSYSVGWVCGGDEVGGFVGRVSSNGVVERSYCSGTVWGENLVGGLIGRVSGTTSVESSYCTGQVSGDTSIGGFVGRISDGGIVAYSYCTGEIAGSDYVGGFVGEKWEELNACFWDVNTSGTSDGIGYYAVEGDTGLTGLTTSQMKVKMPFQNANWDFEYSWLICDGYSYPKLSWQDFAVGDISLDGMVDNFDLGLVAGHWLETGNGFCQDIYNDGVVDFRDHSLLADDWLEFNLGYLESPYDFKTYQYKVQLHCHSTNSDGDYSPQWVMQTYEALGYSAVALTDHDSPKYSPSLEDPGEHNIIHIPGVEYTYNSDGASWNHMTASNIQTIHHTDGRGNRQAQINQARIEGGLSFIAHPHDEHPRGWSEQDILEIVKNYDGIEILNGARYHDPDGVDYPYKIDCVLQAGRRTNIIAVDDFHSDPSNCMDRGCIVINSNFSAEELTRGEVVSALKSGNYFSIGRQRTICPTPPRFTNISVNGYTITVETDKNVDIEFITNRRNYYREGVNYVQKYYDVTRAQYTACREDKFVRITAIYTVGSRESYAWSNPIYVTAIK